MAKAECNRIPNLKQKKHPQRKGIICQFEERIIPLLPVFGFAICPFDDFAAIGGMALGKEDQADQPRIAQEYVELSERVEVEITF